MDPRPHGWEVGDEWPSESPGARRTFVGRLPPLLRPRVLRRGATREEAERPLPGDEIVPPNPFRSTMAETLSGTPEQIWPWLVQVGWGRGAFYSHNGIEGLFGLDLHNADRIHPEWQDLKIGDKMWMSHPRLMLLPETKVAAIDVNRALVFTIDGPEGSEGGPSRAWSFVLEPIDDHSTRLIALLQVHRLHSRVAMCSGSSSK